MKTDKQLYKLFSSNPNYLFQSAGIRRKTKYVMQSVTLKEFERRTDGILQPDDPDAPTYVAEFQAQPDKDIYHRLVMEMSSYAMENEGCDIRGIIVFLYQGLDPKTKPWHYLSKSKDKLLKIVYLDEYVKKLEKRNPNHPMVIVFKPVFEKDEEYIKHNAYTWYQQISKCRLNKNVKDNRVRAGHES